jgi:hypothetical protein
MQASALESRSCGVPSDINASIAWLKSRRQQMFSTSDILIAAFGDYKSLRSVA